MEEPQSRVEKINKMCRLKMCQEAAKFKSPGIVTFILRGSRNVMFELRRIMKRNGRSDRFFLKVSNW